MNVIKVYGGLGNQLFQYAFGKAMIANGIEVQYDISYFRRPQNPPRYYILDKFYTTVNTGVLGRNKRSFNEVKLGYVKNMDYLKMDNCDFFGYWQHPEYFNNVFPQLKEEFRVRKEFYTEEFVQLREKIICENSVSLHVRRTDYVQIKGHYLLSLEYYETALRAFSKTVGFDNIYVFSDDIEWCKENFPQDYVFIDIKEDYLAFDLMRVCKHNINGNSTFSWWAARLNSNPYKVVITPVQWRTDSRDPARDDPDFIDPEKRWVRIDSPGIIT